MPEKRGSMVRGISIEMQEEILALLLFDNEMYDATKDILRIEFFNGTAYQNLFKALVSFHKKTKTNPTIKDMMIEISLLISNTDEVLIIKSLLQRLYADFLDEYVLKDDEVKRTHFEEFIRRNGAEYCFEILANDARNDDGVDWDKVIPHLKKYTDFTIGFAQPHFLSDEEYLIKAREEAIGANGSRKIKFFLDEVNKSLNHGALLPGTLTMVSASPGVGKSLALINQGAFAAINGFNSLHLFLGDINNHNANLRYMACFSGLKLGHLNKLTEDEHIALTKQINEQPDTLGAFSRAGVISLPAGKYSVEHICNEIDKSQHKANIKFDQIIIDYDANIKTSGLNMYDEGGEVYNKLREFGKKNSSVMFVASQPKIPFYGQELLTLDCASESSQKQHVVDLMLTFGRPGKLKAPISKMFIPKNRDGVGNITAHLYVDGGAQSMQVISGDEYERLKREAANQD